ncbi:hypothetical protein GCM10017750_68820 [Streptomyces racemochromogenes]
MLGPSSRPGPAVVDTCADRDEALRQAKRHGYKAIACHQSGLAPNKDSIASLKATVAKVATTSPRQGLTPQPLPSWCADHLDGNWWITRRDGCLVTTGKVTVVDTRGTWRGTLTYHDVRYVYNRGGIDSVYQFSITPWKYEGTGLDGMTLRTVPTCQSNCTTFATTTRDTLVRDVIVTKEMGLKSTLVNRGDRGDAVGRFTLDFTVPGEVFDRQERVDSLPLLCDHTLPGNNTLPGCVFEGYDPWLGLSYSDPYLGRNAINVGWAIYTGLPSHLQRLRDPSLSGANGDRACPSGASYPRPDDHQCDEYPFRSTEQGAKTSGTPFAPRTFGEGNCPLTGSWPNTVFANSYIGAEGWARCNIPTSHNRAGGARLDAFYRDERVQSGGWFNVYTTG